VVEFKGRFYSIPASKIGPKPVQKPHSPILFGGTSSKTFLRIETMQMVGYPLLDLGH